MNHSKKQDEAIRRIIQILFNISAISLNEGNKIDSILSEEEKECSCNCHTGQTGGGCGNCNINHKIEPSLEEKLEKIQEWLKNNKFGIIKMEFFDEVELFYNKIK